MGVLENRSPHYEEMIVTAGSDLTAGDLVTSEDCYVFPLIDVDSGDDFAGIVKSPKVEAEKATGAISPGDAIYWVTADSNVATSGDILIGFANKAAASADDTVSISFDGRAAFLKT